MTASPANLFTWTVQGLSLAIPLLAISWVLDVPLELGLRVYPEQIAALMLGMALAVVFARNMALKPAFARMVDTALFFLSLLLGIWVLVRFPLLSEDVYNHPIEGLALGTLTLALVIEGLRRVVGWTLVVITGLMLAYALWGNYVPKPLSGRAVELGDVLRFIGTDSTATWGAALQIACFVVVIFVLFGGVLLALGGGEVFTQAALRVAGKGPGNTAKVAVIASGLFGAISGSAVSNVMSTGVMTIPMMRRSGFRPSQAGAIEAVASTGGQLAPPVMGAAAFLMAELLQLPYAQILLAALLPAALYYLSLYCQIDFIARRDGHGQADWLERQDARTLWATGWLVLAGFAVLLGTILFARKGAELAAIWSLALLAGFGLLAWAFQGWTKLKLTPALSPRALLDAVIRTGGATADVLLITAAAGIIIGLLSKTGLGFSLSFFLVGFGGENLFGLLMITALVAIVLGLGLPTTGVYLLLATMAAPALIQLGLPELSAHMFVFYYGMLSMITPPIALAAYAAASISGAGQVETGLQAFRFGWIAYVLPFLFIYEPALLMNGTAYEIALIFIESLVALVLVTGALTGHALRPLGLVSRLVWFALGALLIVPLPDSLPAYCEPAIGLVGIGLLLMGLRSSNGTNGLPAER